MAAIGIRWTVGNVSQAGFAALRLSVWGARQAFGPEAALAICVNSLDLNQARESTGELPDDVEWIAASSPPDFLDPFLDREMAEGVAWKLAPMRVFPDRYELSLDNDCILWSMPDVIKGWLREAEPRCLIAADVKKAFGAFDPIAGEEPRNTGIRGFPPGYDLGAALRRVLREHPTPLRSELDEQGLQALALDLGRPAWIVPVGDVSICSPFWPHEPKLGRHGAHFVGLNARNLPWSYYDRPASACVAENWRRHFPELCRLTGAPG